MSRLGLSVMIGASSDDGSSAQAIHQAIGKTIVTLSLGDDEALHFVFSDGSKLKLYDDGQSCCEIRYMRTDDNLDEFVGAELRGFEIKAASAPVEDGWDCHEIQFLEVLTSKGSFVMSSHNEHNGYYGGFWIVAEAE